MCSYCAAAGPEKADNEVLKFAYNNFFRRNPVYFMFLLLAAIVANEVWAGAAKELFRRHNDGKSFDEMIKDYPNMPPGCEEEDDEDEDDEE